VSANGRYLQTTDGKPFFWLGDTGWLLFKNLDREEAERYLEHRRVHGFNLIQVMVLNSTKGLNAYGDAALVDADPARPLTTPGSNFSSPEEYDFWDHVDWIVDRAASKGIYIGMVCAWGSIARSGQLNATSVETYTTFMAERYRGRSNIVWLTGGDTHGDRNTEVWQAMGRKLKQLVPHQLVTFHPFGRTQSSTWFHTEPWLDFNMFQSGHRRYGQDDTPNAKDEDNWRYVREDLDKKPPKPTIDGEPSYEAIPQGLHDWNEPLWKDSDVRRYAWWSVLSGAFGHTYGHASVMSMRKAGPTAPSGVLRKNWYDAIDDPGAKQMRWVKQLVLSRPFFERVPDQDLIAGDNGQRYDYIAASRGNSYAFLYTYTGRPFEVRMGRISGKTVTASWFDPRTGTAQKIGDFPNSGVRRFVPPGTPRDGNDWVLVLDDQGRKPKEPGVNR
jgi:hypothetical protein